MSATKNDEQKKKKFSQVFCVGKIKQTCDETKKRNT